MNRVALIVLAGSLFGISVVTHAAAADPFDARVTIAFADAAAGDVIRSLAASAGVKVEIAGGAMKPVTITLTNVRLVTAMNAVCDNALCTWRFDGSLKVTPLPSASSAALPSRISFAVEETPPSDMLRALAAAIGSTVTIEPGLPNDPMTLNFKNATSAEVLNTICAMLQCAWDFDPQRGLRVMQKR